MCNSVLNDNSTIVTRNLIVDLLYSLTSGSTLEWYDTTIDKLRTLNRRPTLIELKRLLEDSDADLRYYASEVLLKINGKASLETVLVLLEDKDDDIRYNLCYLFCDYGDERAVHPLMKVVLHDSSSDVRWGAAVALGKIGNHQALSALEWAAQNDFGTNFEGETVSSAATWAIKQIRNPPQLS